MILHPDLPHDQQPSDGRRPTADPREKAGTESETILRQLSTAAAAVVGFFVLTLGAYVHYARPVDAPGSSVAESGGRALCGMDPNTAEWFELAQLPGIGPLLARRVVAYRELTPGGRGDGKPVFKRAADLCGVRGVGLKKVERIGRFLGFPSTPDRS